MTPLRDRLWLILVAAPVAFFASFILGVRLLGPEELGFRSEDRPRGSLVVSVEGGRAMARAGLQPGDLLVSWDSQPVAGRLYSLIRNLEADTRYRLGIERGGQAQELVLTVGRRPWRWWATRDGLSLALELAVALMNLGLAGLLAWQRPRDPVARLGAALLCLVGTILFPVGPLLPPGSQPFLRRLPLAGALVVVGVHVVTLSIVHELSVTFACFFPRRVVRSPWVLLAIWAPLTVRLPFLAVSNLAANLPELGVVPPGDLRWVWVPLLILRILYTAAVPLLLLWSYRRLEDPNERRRLRLVVFGLALTFVALMPSFVLLLPLTPVAAAARLWSGSWPELLTRLLLPAGPLCLAYAILRHRVFDVRVIVRSGLQYAAARGLLLSVVPLCAVLLTSDLLLHGDEPLGRVLSERGWVYLALAAVAWALHARQGHWLEALDRRFFRERYDAQQLLRGVVDEVRRATGFDTAAARVVERVATALHPEYAAVLVRGPQQEAFRALAVAGPRPVTQLALPATSKLVWLLRLLDRPVEVSPGDSGWLARQLPSNETGPLRAARIEWLFPIALSEQQDEALLAVGPKLSEEPYSSEDQDLLGAITGSLALLLERRTDAGQAATGPAPPPPELLAQRYRLQQPLGQGGMGTVYEASDTTLDRVVAVKLLRPELGLDPEALARFRREARAAAGFSHPNVVVVHDFGVAEDGRPYLVMERLRGRTLREELRREGRLAPARAAAVLRAVARAVDAAHGRQLLHRDLKPENVMLSEDGEDEVPKVLDFGIAKSFAPPTGTVTLGGTTPGLIVGTPPYLAPGQVQGEEPSPAWDLWALSVMAYELLAGGYPFPAPFTPEGWRARVEGQPAPLPAAVPGDRPAWDALFRRAFAPRPAERFASAGQLAAELARLAGLGANAGMAQVR